MLLVITVFLLLWGHDKLPAAHAALRDPWKKKRLDDTWRRLWYLTEENDLSLERIADLVDVTFHDEILDI